MPSSAGLRHLGMQVAACKATGVSLRRDILAMEDAGAGETMIFSDLGVVTTTAGKWSGPDAVSVIGVSCNRP